MLDFAKIKHAKTSSFCSFQDNNLKIDAQIQLKKATKAWYLRRYLNNQNKEHGFSKTPKLRVVDENLANYRVCLTWSKKPAKNKRHTPRGGRRTCYLVVVVVVAVVVVAVVAVAVVAVVAVVIAVVVVVIVVVVANRASRRLVLTSVCGCRGGGY